MYQEQYHPIIGIHNKQNFLLWQTTKGGNEAQIGPVVSHYEIEDDGLKS